MSERGEDLQPGAESPENPLGVADNEGDTNFDGVDNEDVSGLTVREITERALLEEKQKIESPGGEGEKAQTKERPEGKEQLEQLGDIQPPPRFTAAEKELFNALPPQLKAATARMFKDHDRHFHTTQQQVARIAQEAGGLVQNVNAYLTQRPRLVESGYTAPRLVNELLAAHMALENPQTKLSKFAEIAGQLGLSDQEFMQVGHHLGLGHVFGQQAGGTGQQLDISNHPMVQELKGQISSLQQKLDPVYSGYEQFQRQQFDADVQKNVSEAEELRNQKDAIGRYLYPELHDGEFLDQVKPLVSALRNAIPGLSFGEAMRRAYFTVKGSLPGNIPGGNQAKLPAQTQNLTRATRAAISARGGNAPSVSTQDSLEEPPDDVMRRGTRAITEWSLQRIRAGARV